MAATTRTRVLDNTAPEINREIRQQLSKMCGGTLPDPARFRIGCVNLIESGELGISAQRREL